MATATPVSQPGPLENAIRSKLTAQFAPIKLEISNDSWQHRHHAPMRAQGSDGTGETHFSVSIVSAVFQSKTTMQRHRLIYATLKEELDGGLHSLSLQTKTEEELVLAEARNGQSS
ncbi:bola-like protein [Roridomyces roridus]|uniref:Bola-like protein n=1 Tax=Roridomyces roridus TaxID=1738132 RepID=A0AAD7CET2_9AGAR|nr:bola-like protein [Roridomyces roridus]